MEQLIRKRIHFDIRAQKEISALPFHIQKEFGDLINELKYEGRLEMPHGRKMVGTKLFEMRVSTDTIWRGFYAYVGDDILILSFFNKKSQKTAKNELSKALNRLKNYEK